MSNPVGLIQAGIVGAVLGAAVLMSTNAPAQTIGAVPTQSGCCEGGSATGANEWTTGNATSANWPANWLTGSSSAIVTKAPAADTGWWTHGEIEFGVRGFTSAPPRNGSGAYNSNVWQQGGNLASYYEYSDIAPDAFGGGHLATGTNDGLYQVDLWANNIGYEDQSYLLTLSKIGEQYLTFEWDQTPHLYSTTAQTPFVGVGSTNLTVPSQVTAAQGLGALPLRQTDVGIQRNTASVTYRWTPTEAWDFHVDYSHLSRDGTLPYGGVIGLSASPTGYSMVPTPVHDTTQNYNANGEYSGTSFWGQKFTVDVGYVGSQYQDDSLSYSVENPISGTSIPFGVVSMWPDNQANGFVGTLAADLPRQSRYVGTFDYSSMTQNSPFIPMSANFTGAANSINPLPANSLNGEINTFLSNNVLTTKITPALTNKLVYRFYDFDNETPQILFNQWISYDQATCANTVKSPCPEGAIQTLTMKYSKQDASEALNWRPSQYWNFNASYNFERYDWTQADVTATNENTGKISADYTPFSWLTARSSASYGFRTYENYSYVNNVWSIQVPPQSTLPAVCGTTGSNLQCTPVTFGYASAYQQFMFDRRLRTRAQFALDVVVLPHVTVSPTVAYQDNYYGLDPSFQEGINDRNSLSWGADIAYAASSNFNLVLSYYREYGYMSMYGVNIPHGATCGNVGCGPGSAGTTTYSASDAATVDTISAGARWVAILDKLDLNLRLALSKGSDQELLIQQNGAPPTGRQYPAATTWFTHLDATALYKFDPAWVRSLGWKGDLKAKLRYTWESNSVSDWQNDSVLPFSTTQNVNALLLASDNPNYKLQMIAVSLMASW
jgi:MtrB/PioB family decaheme-associated outer membrane protein